MWQKVLKNSVAPTDATMQLSVEKVPTVGEHEVLVKVYAAEFNGTAAFVSFFDKKEFSGIGFCGEVFLKGSKVEKFAVGEFVIGLSKTLIPERQWPEFVVASTELLVPMPTHLTIQQAAVLPHAGLAAYQFVKKLRLPGKSVLIIGARDGFGALIAQFCVKTASKVAVVTEAGNRAFWDDLGVKDLIVPEALTGDHKVQYDRIVDTSNVKNRGNLWKYLAHGGELWETRRRPWPFWTWFINLFSSRKTRYYQLTITKKELAEMFEQVHKEQFVPRMGSIVNGDQAFLAFEKCSDASEVDLRVINLMVQ